MEDYIEFLTGATRNEITVKSRRFLTERREKSNGEEICPIYSKNKLGTGH
jgi:hypothetical protein